ncbi:MAG TPA: tandem-95 repeat protein, partial [Verrucomicrobiae bacterium]|nr:tandem-95 repeat protein [Verrucomicrobiae bacterium]
GSPLTIIAATTTNGVVTATATNLVFSPATNFTGAVTLGYTISDGTNTASANVFVTVGPFNDPPIAVNDSTNTLEDTSVTINALANDSDPEGSPLTITAANTTNGVVNIAGTNLVFTPATNFNGAVTLTYTISDGLQTAAANVFVTVGAFNDPPIAVNDSANTLEDISVTIDVLANDSDPEGSPLTITAANTTNGVVNFTSNNLVFTPATNFNGAVTLGYTISDGTNTAAANVFVTVAPFNDPPFAVNDSTNTIEDTSVTINVLANDSDPEGSPLTITAATTTNGVVNFTGTNLVFSPATNFTGAVTLGYTISDGTNTASANVFVTVGAFNDPPIAVNDSTNTLEDTSVTINVLANDSDPEGSPLTIAAANTTNGVVNVTGTNLVFLPATNFTGAVTLGYTVSDGTNTASASVFVTVGPVNDPPVAANDNYSAAPETLLTIPAPGVLTNDTDVEGNALTAALVSTATQGSLTLNADGSFTYLPAINYVGPDSFTYRANDGSANSAIATVNITVTSLADVAVLKAGPALVTPNASFVYTITVTNRGPSPATNVVVIDALPTNVVFVSASAGGVFSNNNVTWPTLGTLARNGTTNFTLTVSAPTNGTFLNVASASAATPDPDPANNNGTSIGSRVTTTVIPEPFRILQGANVFNPQTGLFEQRVVVTNILGTTAAAVRLLVGDIRTPAGIPRTNVYLYNATGTNIDRRPYVQHNAPLNPGQSVLFTLEFYVPDRLPFTNSLEAQVVLPTPATTNLTGGVVIDRAFVDSRPAEPRYVIEFTSIPGRTYTIIYSDDNMATWQAATPAITANANRTQWYDDGPPKTASKPLSVTSRFYRVIAHP